MSDRSYLLPLLAIAAILIADLAIDGATLRKGLRGDFVPAAATTTTTSATTTASESIVSGGSPVATTGSCAFDVKLQAIDEYPLGIPMDWHNASNVIVKLPDAASCKSSVSVSPTWTVAAWNYTFVSLASHAIFEPPAPSSGERHLVKILRGTLLDVNLNGLLRADGHWETFVVTPPNRAVSLFLDNSVEQIKAGANGAVFVYIKVTTDALDTPITDMTTSPAKDVAGPFSENLKWNMFGNYFDAFQGVEFYNMAGILLQDANGSRLCYMQWWTLREDEGADGYHDHSNLLTSTAFAEIHLAVYSANAASGMQTTLPKTENLAYEANPSNITVTDQHAYNQNDQTGVQIAIPLPPGHAHGPLWSVDPHTGKPALICSGAIQYPLHRWIIQASGKPNALRRYSMWVAFEHLAEHARVPLPMLTQWPNANLQTTMDPANCNATV
ncbi:hypothetical protein MPSEU_000177400 [Mayamaea pseudoterrestris]|nr:hypothetical protein MPSEU_000177400 [Mayamaea pseudoterrestris]